MIEELPERKHGEKVYRCKCDCGSTVDVISGNLKAYKTKSCGCLRIETTKYYATKHGKRNTRLYNIYTHMIQRCYNTNNIDYHNYGERGIKICDEWLNEFMNFYNWAIENGYRDELTIDRIDVNGNYEPDNCRWASFYEQSNNKQNSIKVCYKNKKLPLKECIKEFDLKVSYSALRHRLIDLGWTVEEAFYTPKHEYKCKEKVIENKLRKWLANKGIYAFGVLKQNKTVPDIGYHQKVFNGGYMTTPGIPDLSITIHSINIQIECKQENGLLSIQQKRILEQIIDSGGYGFILKPSNYDDVTCFLQAIIDHDDETKKAMYQVLLGQTYELINMRDRK